MYNELRLEAIAETLERLQRRIEERFPGSSLGRVAGELAQITHDSKADIQKLQRPHWPLRLGVAVAVLVLASLVVGFAIYLKDFSVDVSGVGALLQAIESAAQDVIFLSVAIYFLLTAESRLKRRYVLRGLHRLRTIVHIVDMHQLTKDPEHIISPERRTASSPQQTLGRFELVRYLDYCSELLSLSSKLAALHVQYVNDPVVLEAVSDIEVLAANLSNKIWQKIMILDAARV